MCAICCCFHKITPPILQRLPGLAAPAPHTRGLQSVPRASDIFRAFRVILELSFILMYTTAPT